MWPTRCAIEVPQHARHAVGERRLRRQQADDQKRLARKVEEVSRVRQHAVASAGATTRSSSDSRRRNLQHRVPAAVARQHAAARRRRDHRLQRTVVRGDARRDLRTHRRAALEQLARRAAAPASTPQGRCRRPTPAARARRRPARSGPPTAIHPSFTCGSPTDFDKPPSANDSTSSRVADAAGARRARPARARSRRTLRRR